MRNLYICNCFIGNDLVSAFKEFYGENCYIELAKLSLGLLIAQKARFSELFEETIIKFNRENPCLEALVDEQLTGNNSHLYAFIDVKYGEVTSAGQLLRLCK